jgi:predicted GIY-YIG superfamily endonuclease
MARHDCIALYLTASGRNGTLYLGVTSDLMNRVLEHREERFLGFSQKRGRKLLVWFEMHEELHVGIAREKEEVATGVFSTIVRELMRGILGTPSRRRR